MVLFFLEFYQFPFHGKDILYQIKQLTLGRAFSLEEFSVHCSANNARRQNKLLADLLQRIFVHDAAERAGFGEVMAHAIFEGVGSAEFQQLRQQCATAYKTHIAQRLVLKQKQVLELNIEQHKQQGNILDIPINPSIEISSLSKFKFNAQPCAEEEEEIPDEHVEENETINKILSIKTDSLCVNLLNICLEAKPREIMHSQMLTQSISAVRNIEMLFAPHVDCYQFQVCKYEFVNKVRCDLAFCPQIQEIQGAVLYYLTKAIICMAQQLLDSLDGKLNLFELDNYESFARSQTSRLLRKKIQRDVQLNHGLILVYYQRSLEDSTYLQPDVVSKITQEYTETSFRDFKKGYRKVLVKVMNDLKHYFINQLSKTTRNNQKQFIFKLRFKVLICHLINRLFDKDQIQDNFPEIYSRITNDNQFFQYFFLWIDKMSMKSANHKYQYLIDKYFGGSQ